jgi:hypothetical protein
VSDVGECADTEGVGAALGPSGDCCCEPQQECGQKASIHPWLLLPRPLINDSINSINIIDFINVRDNASRVPIARKKRKIKVSKIKRLAA